MNADKIETTAQTTAPGRPRKLYRTPELIVHGDVAELTRNLGAVNSDGTLGSREAA